MRRAFLTRQLLVVIVAACSGAAASRQFWPRDARAQASPLASAMYVPWEGLVFRTPDGRAIARLSRDAHGGLLELYGVQQEGAARFSAGALSASRPAAREPYSLDDDDPWTGGSAAKVPPTAIGF